MSWSRSVTVEMRNQGISMTEVKGELPLYEMCPGNLHAKNDLVGRLAPIPDHCQVDQENYQAGNPRYGHELVISGNYAEVSAEVENVKIYGEKSNGRNRQERL